MLIENMHDIPYVKNIGPEIVSCMARVAVEIQKIFQDSKKKTPLGIQVKKRSY